MHMAESELGFDWTWWFERATTSCVPDVYCAYRAVNMKLKGRISMILDRFIMRSIVNPLSLVTIINHIHMPYAITSKHDVMSHNYRTMKSVNYSNSKRIV